MDPRTAGELAEVVAGLGIEVNQFVTNSSCRVVPLAPGGAPEPSLQFGAYEGEVQLHDFPNDLKVDLSVIVDDSIAHADDLAERQLAQLCLRFRSELSSGLTDDEPSPRRTYECQADTRAVYSA